MATSSAHSDLDAVKAELAEFRDKVSGTSDLAQKLDSATSDIAEMRSLHTELEGIKRDLAEMRKESAEMATSSAHSDLDAVKAELAEFRDKVSGTSDLAQKLDSATSDIAEMRSLHTELEGIKCDLAK